MPLAFLSFPWSITGITFFGINSSRIAGFLRKKERSTWTWQYLNPRKNGSLVMSPLNITQPLGIWFIMATIFGDVQYSQVMGHLPTPEKMEDLNFEPPKDYDCDQLEGSAMLRLSRNTSSKNKLSEIGVGCLSS